MMASETETTATTPTTTPTVTTTTTTTTFDNENNTESEPPPSVENRQPEHDTVENVIDEVINPAETNGVAHIKDEIHKNENDKSVDNLGFIDDDFDDDDDDYDDGSVTLRRDDFNALNVINNMHQISSLVFSDDNDDSSENEPTSYKSNDLWRIDNSSILKQVQRKSFIHRNLDYSTSNAGQQHGQPPCISLQSQNRPTSLPITSHIQSIAPLTVVAQHSFDYATTAPYTNGGNGTTNTNGNGTNGTNGAAAPFRRDSIIRQSWNNLFKRKGKTSRDESVRQSKEFNGSSGNNSDVLAESLEDTSPSPNKSFDRVMGFVRRSHSRNSSSSSANSYRSTSSVGVGIRTAPATPMSPLQGHSSDSHLTTSSQGQSAGNLNQLSRSPSHNSTKGDSKSQKLSVPSNRSISPQTGGGTGNSDKQQSGVGSNKNISKQDDKEKEPKEKKPKNGVSISRQKKFHRHFQQVDLEEKVINYFSCALVSDILLQGQLYITKNYFAFYSNVFGYVTKLLIPTVSVIKISKEKTGKIFPNAVGVQTAEERHVFGSFISREAAYRLMLSVCNPIADELEPERIPKLPDVEVSSIEDDSSCSVSGNESPPRQLNSSNEKNPGNSNNNNNNNSNSTNRDNSGDGGGGGISSNAKSVDVVDGENLDSSGTSLRKDASGTDLRLNTSSSKISSTTTATTKYPSNVSPSPNKMSNVTLINNKDNSNKDNNNRSSLSNKILSLKSKFNFKFPTDVHIVYVGVILAVILSLFSGFLLYKIQDIQARTSGYSSLDFKIRGGKDVDVYAEILRWQKEMQSKNAEEAQMILASNLEQIARVRKSLETLSLLIHDNNSPYFRQSESSSVPSSTDDAVNET